ncbi:MAG: phosphoribosyltransferase family protein [bacterium]
MCPEREIGRPPSRTLLGDLADVLLPGLCQVCRRPLRERGPLCGTCRAAMARRRLQRPLLLSEGIAALAAYTYEFPVREVVLGGKSGGMPWLLDLLVPGMLDVLHSTGLTRYPRVVVPVPLHPVRRRERGFDQGVRLAGQVARGLGTALVRDALKRVRVTPDQKAADAPERYLAVHDAFAPGRGAGRVRGHRVLLVDDVLTTGATLEAALSALFRAGCRGALCLVAARTARHGGATSPEGSP